MNLKFFVRRKASMEKIFEKLLVLTVSIVAIVVLSFFHLWMVKASFIALALAIPSLATTATMAFAILIAGILVVLNQETLIIFALVL